MSNTAKIINFPANKQEEGHEIVKADLDNGYYRVANELALALCKIKLSDRESRVLHAVMLKTYGFNKAVDWVCNEQLSELTEIKLNHISEVKNSLLKRNILLKDGRKIGVNPFISQWLSKNEKTLNRVFKTPVQGKENPKQGIKKPCLRAYNKQDTNTKDKTNIIVSKSSCEQPSSKRKLKPQSFKTFFDNYPSHRKGGTNAQAWKVWKSENLTEQDAELATIWLLQAAQSEPSWGILAGGQYVFGITKFIRERIWLTPVPETKNQTIDEWEYVRNDTSWASNLDITGAE
ncbi:MAG: replication protein [Alteromonadaceae bacterium]|nr:replication protein [Alteromonadaceae bacterium]